MEEVEHASLHQVEKWDKWSKEGSKESVWSKRTRERLLSQKERLHRILKIDLISKIS